MTDLYDLWNKRWSLPLNSGHESILRAALQQVRQRADPAKNGFEEIYRWTCDILIHNIKLCVESALTTHSTVYLSLGARILRQLVPSQGAPQQWAIHAGFHEIITDFLIRWAEDHRSTHESSSVSKWVFVYSFQFLHNLVPGQGPQPIVSFLLKSIQHPHLLMSAFQLEEDGAKQAMQNGSDQDDKEGRNELRCAALGLVYTLLVQCPNFSLVSSATWNQIFTAERKQGLAPESVIEDENEIPFWLIHTIQLAVQTEQLDVLCSSLQPDINELPDGEAFKFINVMLINEQEAGAHVIFWKLVEQCLDVDCARISLPGLSFVLWSETFTSRRTLAFLTNRFEQLMAFHISHWRDFDPLQPGDDIDSMPAVLPCLPELYLLTNILGSIMVFHIHSAHESRRQQQPSFRQVRETDALDGFAGTLVSRTIQGLDVIASINNAWGARMVGKEPSDPARKVELQERISSSLVEYTGIRSSLIRLLAQLCGLYPDAVREYSGIPAVMNQCSFDPVNPLAREWSILGIRLLCENNPQNQSVIAEFQLDQVRADTLLHQAGFEAFVDPLSGTPKLRKIV